MIVRALDVNHDWTFGKGKNNYLRNQDAVSQNIDTRLLSFFGDCFFAVNQGIDWWNLLGSKNQLQLNLAVTVQIKNTLYVDNVNQISISLNSRTRNLNIQYSVETSFGQASGLAELLIQQG